MAEKQIKAAAAVVGSAAIIAAAAALRGRPVKAAPDSIVGLDEETMNLLIAMAQVTGEIPARIEALTQAIRDMSVSVQGYPPNADSIICTRVQIAAIDTPFQLPDIDVPDDMFLQVKGWPTNAGIIYVSNSAPTVLNINQIWPLLANEAHGWKIKNASALYISGTVAGDWAVLAVEQRGRRG